jgi:tetratricopeptide (TPR) repeat protein
MRISVVGPRAAAIVILVLSTLTDFEPAIAQARRFEVAAVVDAYAQGRYDEALAPARYLSRDAARDFRQQLVLRGVQWVDAPAADRPRRALAAAAFALEFERLRAERGEWQANGEQDCAGRCVIEWACTLLQSRGPADDAEQVWMLASMALAHGVRDWSFLQTPIAAPSERTVQTGHVHHALARFPDDPQFRLARAIALASRNAVTDERDAPRAGDRAMPTKTGAIVIGPDFLNSVMQRNRSRLGDYVKQELESLAADESVGSEARVRLGYLHWVRGDEHDALVVEAAAADAAKEPDVRYVANVLAAQAAQALGDLSAAETRYRAALGARPYSQSATLGLASLLYLRGEAKEAYEIVAAAQSNLPRDDDPWRMFLYGDFPKLPALVGELRKRVNP